MFQPLGNICNWKARRARWTASGLQRSSSAVISANSRSRILLAILDGTIATGFEGLGTKYCIWCGTGPTVSALGVAPDGLEEKAADARRSRPEWPAGPAANTGTDCGSGPK